MFIHGVSTRQVSDVLEPLLGKRICSAQTVSNIVTYLFLDGIYLSKKKAIRATKKPVLVAYGIA
jgi:transposase-like protein